jgi:hypothetical protein
VDELNDAQHDLARASGDVRTRIQQELAAHEAAMSKMNAQSGSDSQIAVLSTRQYGTLAGRIEAWSSQRSRYQLIQQARQQAQADAASLTLQHNALEAQANASSAAAAASSSQAGGKGASASPNAASSPACSREGNSASFSASTTTASRPSSSSQEFTASGQPGAAAASHRDAPDPAVAGHGCFHFDLRHSF